MFFCIYYKVVVPSSSWHLSRLLLYPAERAPLSHRVPFYYTRIRRRGIFLISGDNGVSTISGLTFSSFLLDLLLSLHRDVPVVDTGCSNLHRLGFCQLDNRTGKSEVWLTVICSLKKSKSSSQLDKLVCADDNLELSSSSASLIGYDNITFACYKLAMPPIICHRSRVLRATSRPHQLVRS